MFTNNWIWCWTSPDGSCLCFCAGAAGPRLFTIHQIDANTNNLPKAHTWCVPRAPADTHAFAHTRNAPNLYHDKGKQSFQSLIASFVWTPLSLLPSFNRIDIPPYESYDKLYDKLLTAIEETCGFAVEWETHWRACLRVNTCNRAQDSLWSSTLRRADRLAQSPIRSSWTSLQSSSPLTTPHILPLSISVWTAARESSPCHVFFIQLFVWGFFCFVLV